MHVLLMHQAFATPAEAGGTRHYEIGRHLVNSGHRFTAITSRINYQTREEWQGDDTETPDGIEVSRIWAIASVGGNFVNRLLAFVSFMISGVITGVGVRRVDLVWGTSPPSFKRLARTSWQDSHGCRSFWRSVIYGLILPWLRGYSEIRY